jgi:putative DNA primase/helicase
MKSPAMKAALSPLRYISVRAGETFAKDEEEYKRACKKYEIEKKVLEAAATRESKGKQGNFDGVDGKALNELLALKEPDRPVMRRYIVSDSTVEKLGDLLLENPVGILCNRDELFGLLDNLEREDRASDRAFYMSCWNGSDTIEVDRIGRGSRFIYGACLSLIGSTQRGRLAAHLSHSLRGDRADDGLMQRFSMLVFPDISENWQMIDAEPDPEKRRKAYSVMEHLNDLTPEAAGADRDEKENGEIYTADAVDLPFLRLNPDGFEQFAEWLTRHERRIRSRDMHPAMGAHLAKYKKLVPAIALIAHLTERQAGPISAAAAARAIKWAEFPEKHAWRAYASANVINANAAHAILKAIWAGRLKTTFTARDVQRAHMLGLDTVESIKGALDLLVDYGWLTMQRVPTGGRGRPSDKYTLSSHPKAARLSA